jgi:MFS family permease
MSTANVKVANVKPQKEKVQPIAWFMLVLVWLASLTAPLNMFKVPTLAGTLIPLFGMTNGQFGWLMSIFSLMGVLLAFPAGFIVKKFGLKTTAAIAMIAAALGSVMGAFAGNMPTEVAEVFAAGGFIPGALAPNLPLMLFGRFLEGICMGLIGVVAPAAISIWFPASRKSMALGFWTMWVPISTMIMFNLAPALAPVTDPPQNNWQIVWWVAAIYTVVILVLFLAFYKLPAGGTVDPGTSREESEATDIKVSIFSLLKDYRIWLVGISFMFFNFSISGAINTYYPTYLGEGMHYDVAFAAFASSLIMAPSIICNPAFGALMDKVGHRKIFIIVGFILMIISFCFAFISTDWGVWLFLIIAAITPPFVVAGTRSVVPDIMGNRPVEVSTGMAVLSFAQNLGMVIGPFGFGLILDGGLGWGACGVFLIVFTILALIPIFALKVKNF